MYPLYAIPTCFLFFLFSLHDRCTRCRIGASAYFCRILFAEGGGASEKLGDMQVALQKRIPRGDAHGPSYMYIFFFFSFFFFSSFLFPLFFFFSVFFSFFFSFSLPFSFSFSSFPPITFRLSFRLFSPCLFSGFWIGNELDVGDEGNKTAGRDWDVSTLGHIHTLVVVVVSSPLYPYISRSIS